MKIGLCTGCFDLFHEGHRYFLQECLKQCTHLIVAVNSDESVRRLKGKERPKEPLAARMLAVRGFAQAVIPFDGHHRALTLAIEPDVILRGYDQDSSEVSHFIPMVRINRGPDVSTTSRVKNA